MPAERLVALAQVRLALALADGAGGTPRKRAFRRISIVAHDAAYTSTYSSAPRSRPTVSASAPTKVPKTIDAPKPATKSCAISACEKPYAA